MEHKVSSEILQELALLGDAFLLGVALMIFYDVIRVFRCVIRHPGILVDLQDLMFWVVAAGCIFYLLFLENSGRVRMYAIAGTGLGMLLYYVLWGRRVMRWIDKGIKFVKKSWFFRKKG